MTKGYTPREIGWKDSNGNMISNTEEILTSWNEYFHEQLYDENEGEEIDIRI